MRLRQNLYKKELYAKKEDFLNLYLQLSFNTPKLPKPVFVVDGGKFILSWEPFLAGSSQLLHGIYSQFDRAAITLEKFDEIMPFQPPNLQSLNQV